MLTFIKSSVFAIVHDKLGHLNLCMFLIIVNHTNL